MMHRYRQVNLLYFITIGVVFVANFIPLAKMFPNYAMLFFISQIIIVLPSFGYLIWSKQRYTKAVCFKKVSGSNIALLVFFSFCMTNVMAFINALSRIFAKDVIQDSTTRVITQNPFIVSLIAIAIIPAIFEETVYRGIFYQEYRKVNPLGAIFLSALLFALLHGNINQASYAFCMGIVYSLVIEATDSVLSTMILHFINNGTSVVLLYMAENSSQNLQEAIANAAEPTNFSFSMVVRAYAPAAIIFGVAGYFIFRVIAKNCGRWEHIKNLFTVREKKSFWTLFTPPLIASIVILFAVMIANEIM